MLYALDKDGAELDTLYDAVKAIAGRVIPAFKVEDEAVGLKLSEFINYNNIGDCFVISSDGDLANEVCDRTRSARPVLDLSGEETFVLSEVRLASAKHGIKPVILNSELLNESHVTALRATAQTVFLVASGGEASVRNAIFKGASGIVTKDPVRVIAVMESITEKTISFPPLLVAHRGDMQYCPENVLRAFISAAQSGASVIELDVILTSDGHLAINHDSTTTHWSQKIDVKSATREQLKALTSTSSLAQSTDTFTFLDEVFAYFSQHYTDKIIHVEMKDNRHAAVDKVIELAKQYGMMDRILVICGNHDVVRYASRTHGVAVQMTRSYIYDKNDLPSSLAYACEQVTSLNSSFYTVWGDCIDELNRELRHRGIKYCAWTTSTEQATDADYTKGYPEFTSNTPHRCDGYAHYLRVTLGSDGSYTVTRVNYDGTVQDVTGSVTMTVVEGDVEAQGRLLSGEGVVCFSYRTSVGGFSYDIYSLCITVGAE